MRTLIRCPIVRKKFIEDLDLEASKEESFVRMVLEECGREWEIHQEIFCSQELLPMLYK